MFLPLDPAIQLLRICFMETATCTKMFISTWFIKLKDWRQPKWLKETCLMAKYEHSIAWGKGMLCESIKLYSLYPCKACVWRNQRGIHRLITPLFSCFLDSINKHMDLRAAFAGGGKKGAALFNIHFRMAPSFSHVQMGCGTGRVHLWTTPSSTIATSQVLKCD